jgi:hypothetical protein
VGALHSTYLQSQRILYRIPNLFLSPTDQNYNKNLFYYSKGSYNNKEHNHKYSYTTYKHNHIHVQVKQASK